METLTISEFEYINNLLYDKTAFMVIDKYKILKTKYLSCRGNSGTREDITSFFFFVLIFAILFPFFCFYFIIPLPMQPLLFLPFPSYTVLGLLFYLSNTCKLSFSPSMPLVPYSTIILPSLY